MRVIFLALFSLIITKLPAQDSVKLSGKILHPVSDSVAISYNDNLIAYYPKQFFARVDTNGSFSITFPVPHGIYVQTEVSHGIRLAELIIHQEDSLVITVDANHFDSTIHYTGRGSEVQNFIALHTLARGRMNQYTVKIKSDIYREPADFLKSIDQEKKIETDFLNKYKARFPETFVKYWTAFYQYYNYFFIEQYPQIHEMVKHMRYTDTIPQENYAVLEDMPDTFNDTFLQLPPYLLYLTGVLEIKLKAAGYVYLGKVPEVIEKMQDSVNNLAYRILPDKSAEYFIAQNLYGRARNQELERTRKQLKTFKKHWPKSSYLAVITKQVSMAEKLSQGQPAPDFAIHTPQGKDMKLSDLRGKVVYLGFWACWCKQCVGEMAGENKIKDLTKDKPLEFVYVSIDNDTASERTILDKFKIDGIFTNASGGWEGREAQLYGVQSLPAYYLIDEDGNFALQNPPSPAQPTQLILEIEKLFK